jgi:glutaconate CoA-transferase subunit B
LYVPRHTRDAFPARIDFRSGIGFPSDPAIGARWPGATSPGPRLAITDRCVMDFAEGRLRVVSAHRGQTLADIRGNTGFELPALEPLPATPAPTPEELSLLREEIDPDGLRDLELLGTRDRLMRIYSIVNR